MTITLTEILRSVYKPELNNQLVMTYLNAYIRNVIACVCCKKTTGVLTHLCCQTVQKNSEQQQAHNTLRSKCFTFETRPKYRPTTSHFYISINVISGHGSPSLACSLKQPYKHNQNTMALQMVVQLKLQDISHWLL